MIEYSLPLDDLTAFKALSIVTPDLMIRPFTMDDCDDQYVGWLNDPAVAYAIEAWSGDRSRPALEAYVAAQIAAPNRLFFSLMQPDGRRVGTGSITLQPAHRTGYYGYMFGEPDGAGGGVSLRTQAFLLALGFEGFGMRCIHGAAFADNIASRFNLKQLGFIEEGVARQRFYRLQRDGSRAHADMVHVSCLDSDFAKIRDHLAGGVLTGRRAPMFASPEAAA